MYFDGRKDATQVTMQEPSDKFYSLVQLEDHYTVGGEFGKYYLTHFSTDVGKGRTIARKIFNIIAATKLHDGLAVAGPDGTATMTGKYKDCITILEELLNKPLQWVVFSKIPMSYSCIMSLVCLIEPKIVLTYLQDQLRNVQMKMFQVGQLQLFKS